MTGSLPVMICSHELPDMASEVAGQLEMI